MKKKIVEVIPTEGEGALVLIRGKLTGKKLIEARIAGKAEVYFKGKAAALKRGVG